MFVWAIHDFPSRACEQRWLWLNGSNNFDKVAPVSFGNKSCLYLANVIVLSWKADNVRRKKNQNPVYRRNKRDTAFKLLLKRVLIKGWKVNHILRQSRNSFDFLRFLKGENETLNYPWLKGCKSELMLNIRIIISIIDSIELWKQWMMIIFQLRKLDIKSGC